MKAHMKPGKGIKAAGGVRTLETLRALHAVGVRRFGIGVKTARTILEEVTRA